jgi:hypothetical protein
MYMIKYWLVIFMWTSEPIPKFVEKQEVAFQTEAACKFALKNSPMYSPEYKRKAWCITNDHREGRKIDKNVPLEPTPFGY